ncbi:MAG: hypothetical protein HYT48_02090 [Candidatus Vogelbacteria bacterium]|nr:hypothetical protein [Candidatus Vogelbacteria bacterium]
MQVQLSNGETIESEANLARQVLTYVRIGKRLVLAIVAETDAHLPGVYLLQENAGKYCYLGDISLSQREQNTVIWNVCTSSGSSEEEFQRRLEQVPAPLRERIPDFREHYLSLLSCPLGH